MAVEGEGRGLAVLNKGLPEYEVTEDGVIYLTLLRCVGWLSKDDLKTRPGHAGPPYETPEAQCLGRQAFEYAIVPYEGDWLEARVWEEAARFNLPLMAVRIEGGGRLPKAHSFLQVEPEELAVSAIKTAEAGDGLIVRAYNPSTSSGHRIGREAVEGHLRLWRPFRRATLVNLNEGEIAELEADGDGGITLPVRGGQIVTVKFMIETADGKGAFGGTSWT